VCILLLIATSSNALVDGGPSLGLDWSCVSEDTLHYQLDAFEEFRGGVVPEVVDEDEVSHRSSHS
jgi:hypothetical protein